MRSFFYFFCNKRENFRLRFFGKKKKRKKERKVGQCYPADGTYDCRIRADVRFFSFSEGGGDVGLNSHVQLYYIDIMNIYITIFLVCL